MLSTVFYIVPLVPGGMFLGTLLLLLIVPVFAVAALALAVLLAILVLLALVAATATVPVLLVRAARRQPRAIPSLDALRRSLRLRRRIPARRQAPADGEVSTPWSDGIPPRVQRHEEDPWALDPLSPLP